MPISRTIAAEKTNQWVGVSEMLVGLCVIGICYGLFAGQPCLVVAATGPILVFEEALYQVSIHLYIESDIFGTLELIKMVINNIPFIYTYSIKISLITITQKHNYQFQVTQMLDLDFISFRCWVGLWMTVIIFVTVALEGSVLVRFFTRFVNDIFAILTAVLLILMTFKKIILVCIIYTYVCSI